MNLRPFSRMTRGTLTATILVTTLLGASGCGPSLDKTQTGGGTPSADSTPSTDPTLVQMLPASIRDKGTMTIAAAVYAPAVMEPTGGGQVTGWDIEITRQAAALLGLKVDFKIIPFDGVIPGLQAGRYDAATGEINVTPDRTKVVTFVTNHVSKDEFIVKADSAKTSFDKPSDVCGLTIGASLGSSEAATAQSMADACKSSGGDPVTVQTFQTQAQVNLALSQSRIGASLASGSQAAYTVQQTNGQFKLAKVGFGPEIQTGLALANNADTAKLAQAFQAATDKLIKDGGLAKILDKLNGGLGVVDKSEILPKPSS
jgi:polar amino acid transport system substrate-binding protein